ncbi:MAG TPA: uroporphyrinogen-III synthase [Pseudorhodoplanes sp.]|nr:uroporphyrinogen-III synthase [Pseudorhodoplanes sp.]
MRLLLTRPLSEAERTAKSLRAMGHDVVIAPVLMIETIPNVAIGEGPYAGVVMTSGNAARAVAGHPQMASISAIDCFAVGSQTAEAARQAGFGTVHVAGGDGGDLARLVGERLRDQTRPLLYLAGDDRARDMAAELAPYGLRLEIAVVYRARAARSFPPEVAAALKAGHFDGVMHYSRRSTAIFVDCVQVAGADDAAAHVQHFCLSARASEPLATINANSILVAQNRDESAMLALVSAS